MGGGLVREALLALPRGDRGHAKRATKERMAASVRWGRRGRTLALGALGAALMPVTVVGLASRADAETLDPTMPLVVAVGAPRGHSVGDRVDARRTGRSKGRLPAKPTELWRRQTGATIETAPLVDANGGVWVALAIPEVVRLSPLGGEDRRVRLGASGAATSPTMLSDGTVLVVTGAGSLVGVARDGAVKFTTSPGFRGREVEVAPVGKSDGGAVIASGKTLLDVAGDGTLRAKTELSERIVGSLLLSELGTLAIGETGSVYAWKPPLGPRKVGSFGGSVKRTAGGPAATGGAAMPSDRMLFAVVDGKKLVTLDLKSGLSSVRAPSGPLGLGLDGPPAVSAKGIAYMGSEAGFVVGLDHAGDEVLAATADKVTLTLDAGAPSPMVGRYGPMMAIEVKPSPPVVVDDDGRVAFVRTSGRVGVVAPDGAVSIATERACGTPVALVPAGEGRFLVACRDGTVVAFGSK